MATAEKRQECSSAEVYPDPADIERDLRRLRSRLLGAEPKRPRLDTATLLALPPLLVQLVGYALMVRSTSSLIGLVGSSMFALGTVSLMGSWFHDQVHVPKGRRAAIPRFLMRAGSAPVAASPKWWEFKHVKLHHTYPSDPRFDPDIQFGWFGRVVQAQTWHPTHRTQHLHMWLLYPLSTLNMLKPTELYQHKRFSSDSRFQPGASAVACTLDKYIPFMIVWIPFFLSAASWIDGAMRFVAFQLLIGFMVSTITQVQHNTRLTFSDRGGLEHFYLLNQIAASSDVGSRSRVWWWMCGGVNFHAAHHVMPTLPFYRLPAATVEINILLARYGLAIPHHRSIWQAMRAHANLIRVLSVRNLGPDQAHWFDLLTIKA